VDLDPFPGRFILKGLEHFGLTVSVICGAGSRRLRETSPLETSLGYGGREGQTRSHGEILPWNQVHRLGWG